MEAFSFWLPFVTINDIQVKTNEVGVGKNEISINVIFNLSKDPNTLESVQVQIGE